MLKVSLIVVSGKPEGKHIPLIGSRFLIGRDESCQLKPNSDQVSRKHAEIVITDDTVTITDLGSRNGTFVNGVQINEPHELKSGELLKIGLLTFAVSIQGVPEPIAAAPVPPSRTTPPIRPRAQSSDVVEQDRIENWLVADNTHPTPDRASGVYDGDTLTIDAFNAPPSKSGKPSSGQVPAVKSPFEDIEFEHLEEGQGDGEGEAGEDAGGDEDGDDDAEETVAAEFIDESNPFYMAKKAQNQVEEVSSKKESPKDSSDAANDILRRMLERRRAGKS